MRDGRKNGTDRIPLSFVGFATWFERIKACPAYEHPVGLTTARFDIGAEAVTAVRVEGLRRGFQGEGGRGRMRPVALITRSHCCGRLFIINRSKAGLWRRQIWRPIKYRRRDGAQTRRGISLSWNFLWPFRIKTLRSSSQCPQMPEVSIHHVEYYGERKEEGRNWLSFDYRTDVDSNCEIIY